MPPYSRSSYNFKTSARRVLLPEFLLIANWPVIFITISPLLVILICGCFVAIWGLIFNVTGNELLASVRSAESYIIVPIVISLFAFVDFLMAFLLLFSISKLNYTTGVLWTFCQVLLMILLLLTFILCPYAGQNIFEGVYYTWAWVLGSCAIYFIYKVYRIRIVFFLLSELEEESRIWNRKLSSPYNYE